MLSNIRIIKAINDKEIEISVAFGLNDGRLDLYNSEQDLLNSSLKENLYSDRLKLTMGPIVKVLGKKSINPKYRFKTTNDCYDLRKSDNKYVINPGESIIVLTNEKIKLNGKYACLIVPRISLSDVGIVVTTAYVDPFYYGLMRLHLSNLSNQAYELTTLEAIAQCFFFELTDPVSEIFKDQFSTKSVFFGQTWHEILNTDRKPFPIKKGAASIDKFTNFKYQFHIISSFIKRHSLILILFTNFFVIFSSITIFMTKFERYTNAMEKVEEYLTPIASEIVVDSGETYGEKEVIVNCAKSDIISVLCNNDEIHYTILSGNVRDETRILFSYSLQSVLTDKYEINFTYIVVRRIN